MTESNSPLPTAYKDRTHLSSTPAVRIIPSSQRPQNKPKLLDLLRECLSTGTVNINLFSVLGILRPDPVTKELVIDSYFPFSSVEEMKENTAWDLKVSSQIKVTPEPTAEELKVLHAVDTTNVLKKK